MFQVNPVLAWQRIHMKNQALFSSKDKSKKLKCRLLQFLFGALRVNKSENAGTSDIKARTGKKVLLTYKLSTSRHRNLHLQNSKKT